MRRTLEDARPGDRSVADRREHGDTEVKAAVDGGRIGRLVAVGVAIVLAIVVLGPRVGPIGTGTLIALVIAVLATRYALQGDRETRLK